MKNLYGLTNEQMREVYCYVKHFYLKEDLADYFMGYADEIQEHTQGANLTVDDFLDIAEQQGLINYDEFVVLYEKCHDINSSQEDLMYSITKPVIDEVFNKIKLNQGGNNK